ncbi:hypothetical protein T440DRAFT_394426 [Plenodomus tracheiphilus IPT5]|uniref:Uncharacterized protein n=1 Tax=Plenodomus tracheiphilus IPT5 TaxID=1408161 RepID=A0A6A7BBK4_9PLEO|nr:hypothetical protein T440DRAFT_394426 [Plenodomus tracheiphilus IPT5]
MNWTGGSLQRTRKSKDGVIQQQKAYFARARTQLQDVAHSPAAPFQPNFLHPNGISDMMGQPCSSGTGAVHHTGHAFGQRGWQDLQTAYGDDQLDHHNAMGPKRALLPSHTTDQPNTVIQFASGSVGDPGMRTLKRSITEADPECQLLEANRERLLKRPDWIGVNPSKPVNLPFVSFTDKHGIGKRRKTEVKPNVTTRRGAIANLAGKPTQDDVRIEGLHDKVRRDDLDYMRIRIGTDALTSAYSTQRHECGQSQDSADPMLFEQLIPNAGTGQRLEFVRPVNHWPDAASSTFQQDDPAPNVLPLTDDHNWRETDFGDKTNQSPFLENSERNGFEGEQTDTRASHVHTILDTSQRSGSSAIGFRMTHRVKDGQQPLRLIFVDQEYCEDAASQKRTGDSCFKHSIQNRKKLYRDVPLLASAAQRLQHVETDADRPSSKEPSAARTIVDVKAWESFLAIATENSGHSATTLDSGNSNLRLYPTARNSDKTVTTWSQLATQGDETQISSSAISASLPSIRRGIGRPAFADAYASGCHNLGFPARKQDPDLQENEKLWRAFVFGSDDASTSQILEGPDYQGAISKELEATSCVSLSAVVSSLNSTPSRVSPTHVSCMEDDILPAANVTPQSVQQERSSPVDQALFDKLSDGELSRDFAQRSASLLNNASCDTSLDPARTPRGTRMVGHSLQHARSGTRTQASAGRRDSGRNYSSMQARLGSDSSDNNLHLVDPDGEE